SWSATSKIWKIVAHIAFKFYPVASETFSTRSTPCRSAVWRSRGPCIGLLCATSPLRRVLHSLLFPLLRPELVQAFLSLLDEMRSTVNILENRTAEAVENGHLCRTKFTNPGMRTDMSELLQFLRDPDKLFRNFVSG